MLSAGSSNHCLSRGQIRQAEQPEVLHPTLLRTPRGKSPKCKPHNLPPGAKLIKQPKEMLWMEASQLLCCSQHIREQYCHINKRSVWGHQGETGLQDKSLSRDAVALQQEQSCLLGVLPPWREAWFRLKINKNNDSKHSSEERCCFHLG